MLDKSEILEVFVSDSRTAGSLLVLAPVVIFIGALLNPHGFGDWSDMRGLLASLGGDPGLTSVSSLIVMIGFILFAAGFGKIKDLMGNGSGAPFMQLGALFIIVGVAGAAVEHGLIAGSGGAAAAPEGRGMATAIALITGAEGVGTGNAGCSVCRSTHRRRNLRDHPVI